MLPEKRPKQLATIIYDGTFEGLLSAIFDIYEQQLEVLSITADAQSVLFGLQLALERCSTKAERVLNGIIRDGGMPTADLLYHAHTSRAPSIEMDILLYLRLLFKMRKDVSGMMGESYVLRVRQMERKVTREAHRMLMFIRFEQAKDGTYFAPIAPQYDVLKMIVSHFRDRFGNQPWVIYDTARHYGAHHDGKEVALITIDEPTFNMENGKLSDEVVAESEHEYQRLWQVFFKSIAIRERSNMKLQQNFMPKRYWKYLTEKKQWR